MSEHPVSVILALALVASLLVRTPIAARVPVVVIEMIFGVIAGPHLLGWIQVDPFVERMTRLGMAVVMFMAGTDVDFGRIRGRPLTLALRGWAVAFAVGVAAVVLFGLVPGVHPPIMIALALSTVGLGVLLPSLREGDQLATPYGRLLLAAGTVGEVAPTVAVALSLSHRYTAWQEFGFLVLFVSVVGLAAFVGTGVLHPKVLALVDRTLHSGTQLPVRLLMFMIAVSFTLSSLLGLEGILGAFAVGMLVGAVMPAADSRPLRTKLEALAFGFLTPFFSVGTGAKFDLFAAAQNGSTVVLALGFLALFLAVHAAQLALYRSELPAQKQLAFVFWLSVPSLSLVVVITEIGLATGALAPSIARALVASALLSTLVFSTLGAAFARAPAPVARAVGAEP